MFVLSRCFRATPETEAPGASVSLTTRRLNSRVKLRRRTTGRFEPPSTTRFISVHLSISGHLSGPREPAILDAYNDDGQRVFGGRLRCWSRRRVSTDCP